MHFKTILFAGLTSLAAVAALPSGSRSAHEGHIAARHHRFIRPRKAEPVSSKKRCAASASTSSAAPEPTDDESGNIAAAKPTITLSTKSAKFTTSTKSGKAVSTKSTETSTDAAAPTSGTGGISINDKLLAIFPAGVKSGKSSWSVNAAVSGAMTLSDQSIRATKVNSKLAHPVIDFQGKKAQQVSFAKNSYAYRSQALGGISMYALGPASQPISNAKVLTFSYSVYFEKGFQFNKGGKMPGMFGGTSDGDTGCSGGEARIDCFSLRFMWREGGKGELYAYLPTDAKAKNKAALCDATNSSCDLDYGWSLGRGKWMWTPGQWHTIAQKITLNDIGKSNGDVTVYHNGQQVYQAANAQIVTHNTAKFRGAMIQSFFGGHDESWASPQDQKMYLADYSLAVLE